VRLHWLSAEPPGDSGAALGGSMAVSPMLATSCAQRCAQKCQAREQRAAVTLPPLLAPAA
jgi:hypothetical protein